MGPYDTQSLGEGKLGQGLVGVWQDSTATVWIDIIVCLGAENGMECWGIQLDSVCVGIHES